jgi:hypothetical protein
MGLVEKATFDGDIPQGHVARSEQGRCALHPGIADVDCRRDAKRHSERTSKIGGGQAADGSKGVNPEHLGEMYRDMRAHPLTLTRTEWGGDAGNPEVPRQVLSVCHGSGRTLSPAWDHPGGRKRLAQE